MSRTAEHEEAVNADSFLDIVASVVSVMIIMVMMTGLEDQEHAAGGRSYRARPPVPPATWPKNKRRAPPAQRDRGIGQRDARSAGTDRMPSARERDILSLAVTGLDQQLRGAGSKRRRKSPTTAKSPSKWPRPASSLEILNRQREAIEKSPTAAVQIEKLQHAAGPHGRRPRGAFPTEERPHRLRAADGTGQSRGRGHQAGATGCPRMTESDATP